MEAVSLPHAIESLATAVLIGLLIGGQRETAHGPFPGLRDFLLVAIAGGLCGLLGIPWLAAPVLVSIVTVMIVYHYEDRAERKGITTELASIATFVLTYLAASPDLTYAVPFSVGATLIIVVALEAKERIQKIARETISVTEFNATLAFIAFVVVIYPLLPEGAYGPYSFFKPRQVWLFVILISSISYVGYFLEKFLGEEKGLFYTSVLGGLASTTAATLQFARESRERPEDTFGLWRAFVIANTVQFPRTLLILVAVSQDLARICACSLTAMFLCGIAGAWAMEKLPRAHLQTIALPTGNPFRVRPALRFGVLFALVVFISRMTTVSLGTSAFYATSLIGGLVDVSTVIAPAADLLKGGKLALTAAGIAVLLALAANAVQKIVIAVAEGTRAFALRVIVTFALWAAVGSAAWWIGLKF